MPNFSNARRFLFPAMGLKRLSRLYRLRLLRLSASNHNIAAGFASGAASSLTPFIGFHFLFGFLIAFFVRGNMLAAGIGTVVGNPFTFPLFFAINYEIGHFILGSFSIDHEAVDIDDYTNASSWLDIGSLWPSLKAVLIGSIPTSIAAYILFYLLIRLTLSGRKKGRSRETVS
jgi:uncharacterized protein (DUF2062 family)